MFPVNVGRASTYPVEEHEELLDNGCHQPSRSPIQISKAFVSILSVGKHKGHTPIEASSSVMREKRVVGCSCLALDFRLQRDKHNFWEGRVVELLGERAVMCALHCCSNQNHEELMMSPSYHGNTPLRVRAGSARKCPRAVSFTESPVAYTLNHLM